MITCTFEDGNQNNLRHVTSGCIVVKGGQILLGRRSQALSSEPGKWCIVGGYAQRDETTAEAGIRETLEETGWEVTNLRLLRINDKPVRPGEDKQNIDFIYLADAVAEVGHMDWETQETGWFTLDNLPPVTEIAFDHADSIEVYRRHVQEGLALPVIG